MSGDWLEWVLISLLVVSGAGFLHAITLDLIYKLEYSNWINKTGLFDHGALSKAQVREFIHFYMMVNPNTIESELFPQPAVWISFLPIMNTMV